MNTPSRPLRRRAAQAGVTLIESLLTLAVSAVALGAAVPGLDQARERRQLEGTAAQLETDIQFTRSQAVAANRLLRMSFFSDGGGSCYVVHSGDVQDCQPAQAPLRLVRLTAGEGLWLHSNVASIAFDPLKGTSTPTGTLRVVGRDGRALHLVVNVMGRVRSCSPNAAVSGHAAC